MLTPIVKLDGLFVVGTAALRSNHVFAFPLLCEASLEAQSFLHFPLNEWDGAPL